VVLDQMNYYSNDSHFNTTFPYNYLRTTETREMTNMNFMLAKEVPSSCIKGKVADNIETFYCSVT
jgi:hypothetical protein